MITIVAGLGRCGTSMMMQMLSAGGVDVVGDWPSYEVDEAGRVPISNDWAASMDGRTVKVLDPQRSWRYAGPTRTIWMDRNPKEQARSQRKFLATIVGVSPDVRAIVSSLRADRKKAMRALSHTDRIIIAFEDVVRNPAREASRLLTFFPRLDVSAAASAVKVRAAECASDMAIEIAQINSI